MLHFLSKIVSRAKNKVLNWLDTPLIVLIYHRVTTLQLDPQLLAVTPNNFRAQMRFLKDEFNIVRFEDDWSNLKKPSVVVTFDDGYADNAIKALPIMEEIGVPATFFITTGSIGTNKEFWWDELEHIILSEGIFPPSFKLEDSKYAKSWVTTSDSERYRMYEDMHPLMKIVDNLKREEWLEQLKVWAHAEEEGRSTHRPLRLDELIQLDISKWTTIGAHGVSHTPLSILSYNEQKKEIIHSKKQLEKWLGHSVDTFSYPFGTKNDYNSDTIRVCKDAGFLKVASNFPEQIHSWTNPYQIPRHLVRNWSQDLFAKNLSDFFII